MKLKAFRFFHGHFGTLIGIYGQALGIIWHGKGLYQVPPLEAYLDEPIFSDDPDGGVFDNTMVEYNND